MKQRYQAIIIGVFVIMFAVLLHFSGLLNYLSFDYLASKKDMLKFIVRRHYAASAFYFVLLYLVVIACAVPAVAPLTLLAGFLFGVLPGALFSLIGVTCGATLSFFLVRYVLKNTVQKKYKVQLHDFNERIRAHGVVNYLLMLQLLTVVPFFVINTLASLANVSLATFLWTTVVGCLPVILVFSFAGRQFAYIGSVRDIFSVPVLLLFASLIVLVLIPIIIRVLRSSDHPLDTK